MLKSRTLRRLAGRCSQLKNKQRMIVWNVSFGIYAFLPQGWIFMIAIILIECLGFSKLMTSKWKENKIYLTMIISNLVSGTIGIIGSMLVNGGWWLVVWFPWVSSN